MRKIISIICLLFLIALTACNASSTDSPNKENSNSEKKKEQNGESSDEKEADKQSETKEKKEDIHTEKKESAPLEAKYYINDKYSIVPIDEKTNKKGVLLTIDDAPDKFALEMAKTLKELDAPAIFFVNGHFLTTPEKKDILRQIHEMGFVIGNHTYNHPFLPDLPEEKQEEEIVTLNDLVEEITDERPQFFRAPNGENTDYTREIAEQENMVLMNWTYGYDWESDYRTKESITDIMLHTELLNDGANLLMHDREWTAAALKDIVIGLREKGYEIIDPALIQTK